MGAQADCRVPVRCLRSIQKDPQAAHFALFPAWRFLVKADMKRRLWKNGITAVILGMALLTAGDFSSWAEPESAGASAQAKDSAQSGGGSGTAGNEALFTADQAALRQYEIGSLEGKTYKNRWADIKLTFPEAAALRLGDGSSITYPLAAGEHVDPEDPELGYRVTVDFLESMELEARLRQKQEEAAGTGYTTDYTGPLTLGGYEYQACKTSLPFSDGTSHHIDTYLRSFDGRVVELEFIYYEELQAQIDAVIGSISQAE